MSCQRRDDVAPYLLGALPADELASFATHLPGCDACRREVTELQVAVDALALAVPPVAPPPALKGRLMATVRAEAELLRATGAEADRAPARAERRPWWRAGLALRPATAAGLAAVLIAVGVGGGLLVSGGGSSTTTIPAQVALASAPGAQAALVVDDDDGQARLRVSDFPAPGAGKVYQLWLKRPNADPVSAGVLFSPDRDGDASVAVPGDVTELEAVMVTPEPAGGSDAPTTQPVVVATPA